MAPAAAAASALSLSLLLLLSLVAPLPSSARVLRDSPLSPRSWTTEQAREAFAKAAKSSSSSSSASSSPRLLQQPSPPSPLTCDTCELIVGVAQSIAENATTVADVKALVEEGCTAIGDPTFEALCDGIMDGLVSLLPTLDHAMQTVAWDIPLNFCAVFFPVCKITCCETNTSPEQIFITLTNDPTSYLATWVTGNDTATSTVKWGPATSSPSPSFPNQSQGSTRTYTESGWIGVIHSAAMTGLQAGQSYTYVVGDDAGGWSAPANFTVLPSNVGTAARPLRIVQIGDMAYDNNSDATVAQIVAMVEEREVDLVWHIGDIR
jgi:hypothetical protein